MHYEKFHDGTVKCIEDEIPFELPVGWGWCRLSEVSKYISDGDHQAPPQTDNGIPFLVISDISQGYLNFNNTRFVDREYYNGISENRKPQKGDLLFTVTGSYGIPVLVNENKEFCFQRHIAIIRPIIITNFFLLYALGTSYIKSICDKRSTGTAQKTVPLTTLRNLVIPIPPILEQHRIVSKLNELISLVDNIESDKAALKTTIQLTKSKILDLAIRGKLVPQDPDDEPASVLLDRIRAEKEELIRQGKIKRDKKESVIFKGDDNSYYEKIGDTVTCIDGELPFELPDEWSWCRGSSCFLPMESRKPSGSHFKYIDIDSIDNKHQTIKEAKITETAKAPSRASRAVFDGSVLFSLVRPYLKNIALVGSDNADGIASTGFYVATSNEIFLPEYLYLLMISDYVVDGLNQFMKGDNSPSISKGNIEKWLYPVPPIREQMRIAEICNNMIAILENIEKSLN